MIKKCLTPAMPKGLGEGLSLGIFYENRSSTDPQSAYCGICLKSFKISNSGVGQLKSHSKCHEGGKRKKTALNWKNQWTLVLGDRAELGLSKKNSLVLSRKKAILKAEILQTLHIVEKNLSFASANDDSDRFKLMFLDSTIAKGYQQSDLKVSYVTKYGIADGLKKQLIYDVKNTPINFSLMRPPIPKWKTIWWVCDLLVQKIW